jgi:sigma-B regulation protein RsbU (phosphoserine phosphatase)
MRKALPSLIVLVRRQAFCIGLAAIIAGFFWANGDRTNLVKVLIYALVIGNLIFPSMQALSSLYWKRRFPYNWILFLLIVAVLAPAFYAIATVAVWWFVTPHSQSLFHLLTTEWKFPVVATFVFSVMIHVSRITKARLEQHNQELQRSVEIGAAQLQVQEQELERAREIQLSLLPKEIPQVRGFEIAGAWRPARMVSGDYYDVFKLDAHRLGVCIADVVGKGVSAALLMANVQAAVRAYANGAESPATLCTKVNRLLCENIATGKYVTFLYAVLDGETRTLTYCNAGHLNPALISRGEARSLDCSGAVLGVFPEWVYQDAAVALEPGDRVLLFTDGITEARGPGDEEFGEERLGDCAKNHRRLSAPEMNSRLLEVVSKFCDGHFLDDATLLVIAAD